MRMHPDTKHVVRDSGLVYPFQHAGIDRIYIVNPVRCVNRLRLASQVLQLRRSLDIPAVAGIPVFLVGIDASHGLGYLENASYRLFGTRFKLSSIQPYILYTGHQDDQGHKLPTMTLGEIGCALSHVAVWSHMMRRGSSGALVLEDDFALSDKLLPTLPDGRRRYGEKLKGCAPGGSLMCGKLFSDYMHASTSKLRGESWDLLYLAWKAIPNARVRRTPLGLIKHPAVWRTQAYVLNVSGAQKLTGRGMRTRYLQNMLAVDDWWVCLHTGARSLPHRLGLWGKCARYWAASIPPSQKVLAYASPFSTSPTVRGDEADGLESLLGANTTQAC